MNTYTREEKIAYFNGLLVEACEKLKISTNEFETIFWIQRIRNLSGIVERMMRKDLK